MFHFLYNDIMRPSEELIKKIKLFEGVRLYAYRDSAGVPTIGAGHTKGVKMGMAITMKQVDALLMGDLLPVTQYLNSLSIDLTQHQFDALCDFAFNLGIGALRDSTLLRRILAHKSTQSIQDEFRRWVYAGGKKLPGLVKRREWEAQMWAK